MNNDIESRLKAALRPVAPSEEFSRQLLERITASAAAPAVPPKTRRLGGAGRPLAWWLSASLAASVILGVGIHEHLQQQRLQQSGLEARREVLEALRVTSQKLNLAYEAVKSQSTPADEKSGV